MRKIFVVALLVAGAAIACPGQTNMSLSNPEALQVLSGTYNPQQYLPSQLINHPDSILFRILYGVSKDTMVQNLLKIDSYFNRNSGSDTLSDTHGIGAVRRWICSKFQQYSLASENRLVVTYLDFDKAICGQNHHRNVLALLPGLDTSQKEVVIVEGHFDTRCQGECDTACYSPGMDDNGSGTVLVMELARVMSHMAFAHTIIFACVTAEDQGLYGSTAFANFMASNNFRIRAVLNNDVVGGIVCGYTSSPPSCPGPNAIDSTHVRVFSYSPVNDSASVSPHKQLARFIRMNQDERINPHLSTPLHINIMFPEDRTGRSGDHIPFRKKNYTAVRFTSQNEHGNGAGIPPDRQHTSGDILGLDLTVPPDGIIDSFFVDRNYLQRNVMMNGVNLGLLANAPPIPNPEFTPVSGGLRITLHGADSAYQRFRVGVRSKYSGSLYFDTLITVSGSNEYVLTGYDPVIPRYISVCNVDSAGVEGLFFNEYKYSVVGMEEYVQSTYGIAVSQNRPNPFSGSTTIEIEAAAGVSWPEAVIHVTDVFGRIQVAMPVSIFPGTNSYTVVLPGSVAGVFGYSVLLNNKIVYRGKMLRL